MQFYFYSIQLHKTTFGDASGKCLFKVVALININLSEGMGAHGQVDRAFDSRSEGLGSDSQCWPYVEVSGKLCSPHCLGPPSPRFHWCSPCQGKVKSVKHGLSGL